MLTHRSQRSLKPIGLGKSACEDQEHVLYLGKSMQTSGKDRFLQGAFILIMNVKKREAHREFYFETEGMLLMQNRLISRQNRLILRQIRLTSITLMAN